MSVSSQAWQHEVLNLCHAPTGTFDQRLGLQLATADDDRALTILVEIVYSDPAGSHEYRVAGHLISVLTAPEPAAVDMVFVTGLAQLAQDLRWHRQPEFATRADALLNRLGYAAESVHIADTVVNRAVAL